jgi:hypothetical protein
VTSKNSAAIIVVIGAGLLAASLLADVIGIGDDPGFGKQQLTGLIVGMLIMFVGLAVMKKSP